MRIRWLASAVLLVLTPSALAAQDRPIVTVLDLRTESVSSGKMRALVSLLISEPFKTARYTVIDVTERDRLLEEVELAASDCTDESCQLEIGKTLSAECILVRELGLVGKKYVLSVRMLETESARTVGTGDGVYGSMEELLFGLRRRGLLRKEAWLRPMFADKADILPVSVAERLRQRDSRGGPHDSHVR